MKLSVEFDEDAVLLLVTTEMASDTKVGSTHSIADVIAWTTWERCRIRMSAHATVIRRLAELRHVDAVPYVALSAARVSSSSAGM